MTIEQLLLEIDAEKISYNTDIKDITLDDLKSALTSLEKRKLLKSQGRNKTKNWIRVIPKKNWIQKLFESKKS